MQENRQCTTQKIIFFLVRGVFLGTAPSMFKSGLILLSISGATLGVPCLVSWPSVQGGCEETGEDPAMVSQDGQGTEAPKNSRCSSGGVWADIHLQKNHIRCRLRGSMGVAMAGVTSNIYNWKLYRNQAWKQGKTNVTLT